MRILVVEHSKALAEEMRSVLSERGFGVDACFTIEEARFFAEACDYGAAIVSCELSDGAGVELLRILRRLSISFPVLMTTPAYRNVEVADKVLALDEGADDYLPRPFQMDELVARISACARRAAGYAGSIINVGAIRLDLKNHIATFAGEYMKITPSEYQVLELLCLRKGAIQSRLAIRANLYGISWPDSEIVDVYIYRIRRALRLSGAIAPYLHNIRGLGYVLIEPEEYEFALAAE